MQFKENYKVNIYIVIAQANKQEVPPHHLTLPLPLSTYPTLWRWLLS